MGEFKFSTIEEAVADLRAGKMIIAVDAVSYTHLDVYKRQVEKKCNRVGNVP